MPASASASPMRRARAGRPARIARQAVAQGRAVRIDAQAQHVQGDVCASSPTARRRRSGGGPPRRLRPRLGEAGELVVIGQASTSTPRSAARRTSAGGREQPIGVGGMAVEIVAEHRDGAKSKARAGGNERWRRVRAGRHSSKRVFAPRAPAAPTIAAFLAPGGRRGRRASRLRESALWSTIMPMVLGGASGEAARPAWCSAMSP